MDQTDHLRRLALQEGIDLPASAEQMLLRHLGLVLERTRVHNLTSILDPEEAISRHVVDSLAAIARMDLPPNVEVLDLGTGAGYPGVVLAIMRPDLRVTLLDSTKKKTDFLEECVRELEIGGHTRVVGARAEEFAHSAPNSQDAIVARAVAPLPALVELSSPLLRDGGQLVALKGRLDDVEIEWGDRAGAECGLSLFGLVRYQLVSGDESRSLVVYRKTGIARRELPRRPGMAQKRPIGRV